MQRFALAIRNVVRHNPAIMTIIFHRGDVIRKVREEAKLTRNALADRIKLPTGKTLRHNTMGDIERTGKVGADTLELIAKTLNVSASYILEAVPKPASLQGSVLCQNPEHAHLQSMLDEILHSEASYFLAGEKIPVRVGIMINVESHHRTAMQSGPTPEGKQPPYDWARYKTGDDVLKSLSPRLREKVKKPKRHRGNGST